MQRLPRCPGEAEEWAGLSLKVLEKEVAHIAGKEEPHPPPYPAKGTGRGGGKTPKALGSSKERFRAHSLPLRLAYSVGTSSQKVQRPCSGPANEGSWQPGAKVPSAYGQCTLRIIPLLSKQFVIISVSYFS